MVKSVLQAVGAIEIILGVIAASLLFSQGFFWIYGLGVFFVAVSSGIIFLAFAEIIEHLIVIRESLQPKLIDSKSEIKPTEKVDGMLKCPKCGTLNPSDRNECRRCSAKLT